MKWHILLLSLQVAALPRQGNVQSHSVRQQSSVGNSTVWFFDQNYDPDALVKASEISGPNYSKQNWNFRKVGDWLIEYASRKGVANSPDFFETLFETPAFGHDNQQQCGITPAGDNCNGGQLFGGGVSPLQLTNDQLNAQMVRQAIRVG
jgi:hypothetical protein